jgi:hypothetical protein
VDKSQRSELDRHLGMRRSACGKRLGLVFVSIASSPNEEAVKIIDRGGVIGQILFGTIARSNPF